MIANFAGDGRSGPARWAARCPASRPRSSRATPTGDVGRRRRPVEVTEPGVEGELALRAGLAVDVPRLPRTRTSATASASPAAGTSPATSRGATPTATSGSSGAADDVIKSAGHLIGPFEVESALHGAPRGRRGRRDRQARPGRRRGRQGVRRARARVTSRATRCARELLGLAPQAARRGGRAAGDRVRDRAAEDPQRQDHAPAAARRASSACPRATCRRWSAAP